MRAWTTTWIVAAALALALVAPALVAPAQAAPAIDWYPVMLYSLPPSGAGALTPNNAPVGAQLVGVGTVSTFGPPLTFLNANIPAFEYSIYVYGLISTGTITSGGPGLFFYSTNYSGGFIEIPAGTDPPPAVAPFPPDPAAPRPLPPAPRSPPPRLPPS